MSAGQTTETPVWAVISAFHPGPNLLEQVRILGSQVHRVVVVDDGSGESFSDVLEAVSAAGAIVQRLPENRGIGASLNEGYKIALDNGAYAVITFDQDSLPPHGFVDALLDTVARASKAGIQVGITAPEYFAENKQSIGERTQGTLLGLNVIQSGMLVLSDVLRTHGLMREDYFIDLIDTEYDLRLRRAGLQTIVTPDLKLPHNWGTSYTQKWFGGTRITTLSTPFRYFYRTRNRLALNREYLTWAPRQIVTETLADLVHTLNVLVLARPRRAMWHVVASGFLAGLRKRMGRVPASVEAAAAVVRWRAEPSQTTKRA